MAHNILFKLATADAGVKHQADIHAIRVLLVAVDTADVVLDADVLEDLEAQVLLHSLTLPVAAVAVADMDQISAGTVILDIPVAQVAVAQLARITVLHMEQAAAVELVLTDRATMVLAVVHTTDTVQEPAANSDQTAPAAGQASHGQTVKDTAITVVVTMVVVVVVVAHHTVAAGAARVLSVLFGQAQQEHIQTTQAKIFNIR